MATVKPQKRTSQDIYSKKKSGQKVSVLTAYDYPFARILDEEGLDVILVGDSVGMVLLGHENTLPVTMDDMLHHTRAVSKAVKNSLVLADMPHESYLNVDQAVENAKRFVREAGADAVKLEGGQAVEDQVQAIINSDIPVMGHVGMLPQTAGKTGDYRVRGKDPVERENILNDALLLDQLGVFAIVLECVPTDLAREITSKVSCPTIGIGAGADTDGQVLVLHDMLGFGGSVRPKFVRQYANLESQVRNAVSSYKQDLEQGKYPSEEESYS